MKRNIILFILLMILVSCAEKKEINPVIIKTPNDTIHIDQRYEAELIVPYNDSILPNFSIVIEEDTFLVPYDEERDCGVFRTVGRELGKTIYSGFVVYMDEKSKMQKFDYEIIFYVKDSITE
ncbi:MAG: hypothetical protein GQ564_12925 [Bacteroidales bacterium]|nr:hypothetical protein [Bacteroidales bacterium]